MFSVSSCQYQVTTITENSSQYHLYHRSINIYTYVYIFEFSGLSAISFKIKQHYMCIYNLSGFLRLVCSLSTGSCDANAHPILGSYQIHVLSFYQSFPGLFRFTIISAHTNSFRKT